MKFVIVYDDRPGEDLIKMSGDGEKPGENHGVDDIRLMFISQESGLSKYHHNHSFCFFLSKPERYFIDNFPFLFF